MRCLSSGAFAGLLLFFSDGADSLSPLFGGDAYTRYFFVSALCTGIVCGFSYMLRGVLSDVIRLRFVGVKTGIFTIIGFLACPVAFYLQLPPSLFIVTGALFGYGFAMLGVCKGAQLCEVDENRLPRFIVYASLMAPLTKLLLSIMPIQGQSVLIIVLLALSSFMPQINKVTRRPVENRGVSAVVMAKGMFERNWICFCGLILCLSVGSMSWSGILSGSLPALGFGTVSQIGFTSGSFAISFLLLLPTKDRLLAICRKWYQYIPMVGVTSILLAWYLFVWENGLMAFGGYSTPIGEAMSCFPIGFSVTFIGIVLVWNMVEEVRSGLSIAFAFGAFVSFTAAAFFLLSILQSILGLPRLSSVDSILKIVYLASTIIYLAVATQKKIKTTPVFSELSDSMIQDFGKRFALSKREIEIIRFLILGRSAPYIAEVEHIALSTVKTHKKHIYAKVGVNSREELLDIIYGHTRGID